MKILIIAEIFFPDKIGGAGKYAYHAAKGLIDKGHQVWVITRRVNALSKKEVIDGIKLFRVNWSNRLNPLRPFLFLKEIGETFEELCIKNNFDLIVFNQPFSAVSVLLSNKAKSISKIYNFYSSWADEFEIKSFLKHNPYMPTVVLKRFFLWPIILLMRTIEKIVISKSDKIITLSQYTQDRLQHLYAVPTEQIKIISPCVDIEKFKPVNNQERNILRLKLGISEGNFILITARNLVPRMGLDNLILAMGLLVREKANVKLIIAGGGFLESSLKMLAGHLGLSDKIKFVGALSEDMLVNYYQASDMFVLPTRFLEGFGIATIEALACGLPALGTPIGGTVEVLSKLDKNFLFSGTGAKCIAEKIIELINITQDRLALSKRCRDFILENYSLNKFEEETEKCYLTLAKKED